MKADEKACRTVVKARSLGWCEKCGQVPGVQMHHRKNRSQSGKWTPPNILHLCVDCHQWITEHPEESYENGWSVRSMENPEDQPVLHRGNRVVLDGEGNISDSQGAIVLGDMPRELRDIPHPGLDGLTPRQVIEQGHVEFSPDRPGCLACRDVLRELAYGERWFDQVGGL